MPEREVVVTLRLAEGNTRSQFRQINSALIDVREELTANNKAIRENAKEQRVLDAALKAGKVTAEQYAVAQRVLVEQRQALKTTNADLKSAEAGLSAQLRESKNEVAGLTEANLRFRDKMAQATIEALRQQGVLGQLETRAAALKNEQNALDKELKEGKITREQYTASMVKTSTELSLVEQREKELRQEVDRLNRELSEGKISVEQYRASVAGLGKTADQAKGSFADIFGSFNDGKQAAQGLISNYIGIGAAVFAAVSGIRGAISTIKNFEQEQANLASILGVSRKEIEALTKSAIEIGPAFGRAPEEVTRLQVELAKLGFTEPQILAAQEAVILLASATGEDLAKSAEVAAATLKGFDLEATETQRVVDVMAQSFNSTSLDLEKFSVAMATVAPAAKAAGFSIEDTTALIGVLSDRGLDASVAGTALRSIFIDLANKGINLEDALAEINASTNKTATAFALFGERAAGSAVILAENVAETDRVTEALGRAGGAAQKMADEQLNTLTGATNRLSAAWSALVLDIDKGDGIISRALKGVVDGFADLINLIGDNGPGQRSVKAFTESIQSEFEKLGGSGQLVARESDAFVQELRIGSEEAKKFGSSLEDIQKLRIRMQRYQAQSSELESRALAASIGSQQELSNLERIRLASARVAIATIEQEIDKREAANEADKNAQATQKEGLEVTNASAEAEKARAREVANVAGSVADLNDQIRRLQEQQAQSTTSAQFATYQAQIDRLKLSVEELTTSPVTASIFNPLQQDTVGQAGSTQEGPLTQDAAAIQAAADAEAAKQAAISEAQLAAQAELISLKAQAEIDGVLTLNEQLAILDAEYKAGVIASEEELAMKRREITQAYVASTAQQFSNLFGVLSDLAQEGSKEQKALAIVQALINTYLGVTQALANLPPPASYVAAGVSLATGLATVGKISSFDQGGMIQEGAGPRYTKNKGDTMLISARAGEMVLNEKQQAKIKRIAGPDVFDEAGVPGVRKSPYKIMRQMRAIQSGVPGFVGGGQITSQQFKKGNGFADLGGSRPSANSLQVAETNAIFAGKSFTAQVSIEEIREVNNRVEVIERMASA